MCDTVCPVSINTGDTVGRLRHEAGGALASAGWKGPAHTRGPVKVAGGAAQFLAHTPPGATSTVTKLARAMLPDDAMPPYSGDLPAGGKHRPSLAAEEPAAKRKQVRPMRRRHARGVRPVRRQSQYTSTRQPPRARWSSCASALASTCALLTAWPACAAALCGSRWASRGAGTSCASRC